MVKEQTNKLSKETCCIHSGVIKQPPVLGPINPIVLATATPYIDDEFTYPRYFNLPNQLAVAKKISDLEGTEDAIIFSSGMAAISTMILSQVKTGDHIIFQGSLYGGTKNLVLTMFDNLGLEYTFTRGTTVEEFEESIQDNTRMIYIESPSNPLLLITDIEAIANLAKSKGIITAIDSTFASPIFQNPYLLGIDLVAHSATKYLGGHSDMCAGVVAGSKQMIEQVRSYALCLGGSLDGLSSYNLDRSIKTLSVRMHRQASNAMNLATALEGMKGIHRVLYPGLPSHPDHLLAKRQMMGFGAMIAFELDSDIDPILFQKRLEIISPTVSLGGVETTICSPHLTSHEYLTQQERESMGIYDGLLRLSVGIEDWEDLLGDIQQAL